MQERHRQAHHLGLVRAVGRSRPGIYRGGFSSLAISPHVCSHWVLGSRSGMALPCDIGLAGRCPRPRGAGPLRRCGASCRSPTSCSALAAFDASPWVGITSRSAHDSTCPKRRRPGFAHVKCKMICAYEAAPRRRPRKSSCPCRGARRLPRDSSRWFGCAAFACAFGKRKGLAGAKPARPGAASLRLFARYAVSRRC